MLFIISSIYQCNDVSFQKYTYKTPRKNPHWCFDLARHKTYGWVNVTWHSTCLQWLHTCLEWLKIYLHTFYIPLFSCIRFWIGSCMMPMLHIHSPVLWDQVLSISSGDALPSLYCSHLQLLLALGACSLKLSLHCWLGHSFFIFIFFLLYCIALCNMFGISILLLDELPPLEFGGIYLAVSPFVIKDLSSVFLLLKDIPHSWFW